MSLAAAISLALLSAQLSAQEAAPVEEVVVTGSYIKQGKFDLPSPVEVIGAEEVLQQGKSNLGEVVRDLTFTQNTDTVANVLAVQDGGQDSNTARFNIRGLGVGSTLTLFDGRRSVEQGAIGSLAPELALERVEVVLDGGAALYGTDAVAGVVNVIPIKKFDGLKTRVFYTQDDGNDFHEPKYSMLWGKTFDRVNVVAAADYSKRSALRRTDRPRYLRGDDDDSAAGNPGQFTRVRFSGTGPSGFADTTVGGIPSTIVDPGCDTFNDGATNDTESGAFPSGLRQNGGALLGTQCVLQFGEFQDYARASEEIDTYANVVFEMSDKVNFEFQFNGTLRTSELISSPTTSNSNNNRLLIIPVANPGNPTRNLPLAQRTAVRASTFGFRPFGKTGTLPSHLDDQGALHTDFTTFTDRYKLGATYEFGDSGWSGETWLSIQTARNDVDVTYLRLDRLRDALQGFGGPNFNQFFNPAANADPRSPGFVADGPNKTANSQEVVDFLFDRDRYEASRNRLTYLESIVTGDLFKLPAGDLAVASGFQVREFVSKDFPNKFEGAGQDYDTSVFLANGSRIPVETARRLENQVAAVFVELQVPIFEKLTLQAAARYEDFRDLGLDTTTPKFALRYEPLDTLSLRASYGEGFLAPSVAQVQQFMGRNCQEVFTGTDPFLLTRGANNALTPASLNGTRSCQSGNPGLGPEESETLNFGFSWRPISGMEISLDYQQIDYTDRIQELASQDLLNRDFSRFLAANNLTDASFRAMSDAARTALTTSWFQNNPDPLITRDPVLMRVSDVTRIPDNISGNEVDVFDLRFRYGTSIGDLGYFSASLSTTYYDKYEYTDVDGITKNALGKRNADTALAPPLPEFRHSVQLGWLRKNQSAGISVRHTDSVLFDGVPDTFNRVRAPKDINAFTTVDVRYSLDIDNFLNGKWSFSIGANNVLDEQADVLPISGGLETRLQDPFGRTVYIEANYQL